MDAFKALRAQMPVCDRCVYLDCAYDCGGSLFGKAAAARYFDDWAASAAACERGGPGRKTFFELADRTRADICRLIGAGDPRGVCFTRNTNEGVSHILMGFDFAPGDNIVTDDIEHPSVLMPCLNAQKLRGVECRVVKAEQGEYLPVDLLTAACDEHTRMILVSHVQSGNGYKIDLSELGAYCRERSIYLIVDAIQSLGFNRFEAEKWGVSAVTAGGYKGLLAGESSAFLWASADLLAHVWPTYTAAGFAMTVDKSQEPWTIACKDATWARKLENSSLDAPGIYVLNAGIEKVLELGVDNIETRIRALYERLWDGLKSLGIDPVTPRDYEHSCASVAFALEDNNAFQQALMDKGIVMTASRLLRVSLGAFNDESDVDAFLKAAKEVLAK